MYEFRVIRPKLVFNKKAICWNLFEVYTKLLIIGLYYSNYVMYTFAYCQILSERRFENNCKLGYIKIVRLYDRNLLVSVFTHRIFQQTQIRVSSNQPLFRVLVKKLSS